MKNRFKRFLSITTVSATGTLIACIVWYGVYCLSGHREILHFWIPYMVLPEILSIGVLAGAVTELVLPPKDMEKWEGMLRLVVHYVLITLGVLVCGWLYGWYELSVVGVLAMCLTSAAVYFFTSALNYQIYKKTAEQMNEKLKEHHKKTAGSPVVFPKDGIDHEKKRNTIWIAAMLTAAVLTGFSGCTEGEIPSLSSSDTAETTTASPEESAAESSTEETAETSAAETEAAAETIPAETTTVPEAGADTSEYAAAAKTLFGALNYIDQIGSGNLPKDETDTIQTTKSGVTYERVTKTQFSSTADLKAYMTASLTQKMIDSRYAAILGTNKPLYIDANGGLYGRQYATSGGFTWIDPEQVTISNATDSSFTASMQYDNFGAADTLTVQIVLDNGLWKIDSMQ